MPATDTLLPADVIDHLVGIAPGDPLDAVRDNRPEAREHVQGSFLALFAPADASAVTLQERYAIGAFVAALHGVDAAVEFYSELLLAGEPAGSAALDVILAEAAHAKAFGPYGAFRGPLAAETVVGPEYAVDDLAGVYVLGDRLASAMEFAHFLVFHPRDASRERLQQLLDGGWSVDAIVTLSQLVAFLTFQIRVVAGLNALKIDLEGRRP
ncbi:CMD domain protein [Agromyces albus]|uniref:CMD domain protein n=1 Tax=Agromyces albus TaxID=205332 RepID=UPI0027815884|nr:CMD domain protein [Agromyces albus]MDQ0573829.1 CMD domain protein [Agromyces albus]